MAAALALLVAAPTASPAASPLGPTLRGVNATRLGSPLTSVDGIQAAQVLGAANRYALATWWPKVAPALIAEVTREPAAVTAKTDAVRRLGMEAMSLAVSLKTGAYDARRAGATPAQAKAVALRLVTVLASSYRANRRDGWGLQAQSSLWESFAGRAGWLLWDDLDETTRTQVRTMIRAEADKATGMPALYLRDRLGRVLRPGNTGAEEDGWTALPLQLATVALPLDPHWVAWRNAEITQELASWARPQDVTSTDKVNGAAISTWLNGSNVEPNGTVVNHSRIAPDYATNLYQNVDAVLVNALAGTAAPESARWGLQHVYASFTQVAFAKNRFLAPGGTIYQPTRVYYPQGCDWGSHQAIPFALVDAESAAFGFGGPLASANEAVHLRQQLAMISRGHDGRTYQAAGEYNYVGREEHTAQLASQYFLTKLVRDRKLASFTNAAYFSPLSRKALGIVEQVRTTLQER